MFVARGASSDNLCLVVLVQTAFEWECSDSLPVSVPVGGEGVFELRGAPLTLDEEETAIGESVAFSP